jgi:phosphoglycolate phosphatase-like HAD superfamily hydrolase
MIRNIIWDVDGTLFDTYPSIIASFQAVLAASGFSASNAYIAGLAQVSLGHCAETLAAEFGLDPAETVERFAAHYAQVAPNDQPLFPGVLQVCQMISAKGGLNLVVTHRSLRSLKILLEHHQLNQYMSACLSAQDGFPAKPDPAMFTELVNRFNLNPAETLAVGDRDIDILAGSAAGVQTCGFGGDIRQSNPNFRIRDYTELVSLLKDGSMKQS